MIDELDRAGIAWDAVHALMDCLRSGKHGLQAVPPLVIRVVDEELWRHFDCPPMHREVRHESFEAYVTDPVPTGLGSTVRQLKNLCRDDPKALDAIDRACKRSHGGDHRPEDCKLDNVQLDPYPTGNSREAALRRLRKHRPDLHEQVIEGELSAHAAMIEAGFRRNKSWDEKAVDAFRKAENRLAVFKSILESLDEQEWIWARELMGN